MYLFSLQNERVMNLLREKLLLLLALPVRLSEKILQKLTILLKKISKKYNFNHLIILTSE